MSVYKTKQRKVLLAFFEEHPDEIFSAVDIMEHTNTAVSISAVYRNLAALEEEGLLRRHRKSGTREVHYQYMNFSRCKGRLHLACSACEKIFHMSPSYEKILFDGLGEHENFQLNGDMTVLYGLCAACQTKGV